MSNISMSDLNSKVSQIVACLSKEANEAAGTNGWKSVFVEDRSPDRGNSSIGRLRVKPKEGNTIGLHVPMEQARLLMSIWTMQEKLFEKNWFGIKITAFPDGKHEVEYNYDTECINDPTFYDID